MQITLGKRDIERLIADQDTDPTLRNDLEQVLRIREFAINELALPDSGSYTDYVDLKRDVTLWIVTAAPELSLEAETWCFPIAGCLSYRGYFKQASAEREQSRLKDRGLETAVNRGLAYSTLGWMNDPVLNTMLRQSRRDLAAVLFHEMAHELIYVKNDVVFNESFASAVAEIGQMRYSHMLGIDYDRERADHKRAIDREYQQLLRKTREDLQAIYETDMDDASKLRQKSERIETLRADYRMFLQQHDLDWRTNRLFSPGRPNNADFALLTTYDLHVPYFLDRYEGCDQQLDCFYEAVTKLAALSFDQRQAQMRQTGTPTEVESTDDQPDNAGEMSKN